jgi:hypothetical protein
MTIHRHDVEGGGYVMWQTSNDPNPEPWPESLCGKCGSNKLTQHNIGGYVECDTCGAMLFEMDPEAGWKWARNPIGE